MRDKIDGCFVVLAVSENLFQKNYYWSPCQLWPTCGQNHHTRECLNNVAIKCGIPSAKCMQANWPWESRQVHIFALDTLMTIIARETFSRPRPAALDRQTLSA